MRQGDGPGMSDQLGRREVADVGMQRPVVERLERGLRVDDPGSPENFARQVVADSFWYADNYADTLNRYTDLIAS